MASASDSHLRGSITGPRPAAGGRCAAAHEGQCLYAGPESEKSGLSKGIGLVTSPVSPERDVTLQLNAEHSAWGLVEHPQPGTEAVLNPVQQVPRDVSVASTLVHMDQQVPVRLGNFSDEPVCLKAGVLVGNLVKTMPSQETLRQESQREVAQMTAQEASAEPEMALA